MARDILIIDYEYGLIIIEPYLYREKGQRQEHQLMPLIQEAKRSKIPILCLSSQTKLDLFYDGIEHGAHYDLYLQKPVTGKKLIKNIEALLLQ